jgi:hypothetical protein
VSSDALVFDESERGPDDELRYQFETIARMPEHEQQLVRGVLDALILKNQVAGAMARVNESENGPRAKRARRPAKRNDHTGNRSAGRECYQHSRPADHHNSTQELIMASANLKPRRKPPVPHQRTLAVRIGQPPENETYVEHDAKLKAMFPWMLFADEFLTSMGFIPGEHVCFSANYANKTLTIAPDHNYRIAGRPITDEEIDSREADYAALRASRKRTRRVTADAR